MVIVHIIKDRKILLHYKKRGHGASNWNGGGGKIESGETPEKYAVREAREEMGANVRNLARIGEITFYDVSGENWFVYVFRGEIDGESIESDESRAQWFSLSAVAYDEMWEDDRYWLPLVIHGISFEAKFYFDGENMQRFKMEAWKE